LLELLVAQGVVGREVVGEQLEEVLERTLEREGRASERGIGEKWVEFRHSSVP
jgi:hypothetical protein